MKSTAIGRQAVVIGAGMGGLSAARALADYFEHVAVLERDTLPLDASHRTGTPQARHTHGLLSGGQRAQRPLSRLCPEPSRSRGGTLAVRA